MDYEPPFFRGCTEEDARNLWNRNPLVMEVGNVNSKHFVLALKVRYKVLLGLNQNVTVLTEFILRFINLYRSRVYWILVKMTMEITTMRV